MLELEWVNEITVGMGNTARVGMGEMGWEYGNMGIYPKQIEWTCSSSLISNYQAQQPH